MLALGEKTAVLGSSRLYRLGVSQAQKNPGDEATRFIAYAPIFPSFFFRVPFGFTVSMAFPFEFDSGLTTFP